MSIEGTQPSTLSEYVDRTETHSEPVTKTIVCQLETSQTKTEYIRTVVDAWQEIADTMSNVVMSHRPFSWKSNQTVTYQAITREFPAKNGIKSSVAQQAGEKVVQAYDSWESNGCPNDNHPSGNFGDGDYCVVRGDDVTVAENNRGWGVKLALVPYEPMWFHIKSDSEYHREYLSQITDGTEILDSGSAEIRLSENDDGSTDVYLHLTVTDVVEVYDIGDVPTYVGVDLGERTVYTTAVVNDGAVSDVTVRDGGEFRHHRNRLSDKVQSMQEQGDIPAKHGYSNHRLKYTGQMTHTFSREIVDIADDYSPCGIVLEDLTEYRKDAKDPIHDWPYAQLRKKILYKATELGIPVTTIDARNTSMTCRKCGYTNQENRPDGAVEFECTDCGYQVHSDVNAAINIAQKYVGGDEKYQYND